MFWEGCVFVSTIGIMPKTGIQHHIQTGQVLAHDTMVYCCRQSLQTMLRIYWTRALQPINVALITIIVYHVQTQQYMNCDTLPKQVL